MRYWQIYDFTIFCSSRREAEAMCVYRGRRACTEAFLTLTMSAKGFFVIE